MGSLPSSKHTNDLMLAVGVKHLASTYAIITDVWFECFLLGLLWGYYCLYRTLGWIEKEGTGLFMQVSLSLCVSCVCVCVLPL